MVVGELLKIGVGDSANYNSVGITGRRMTLVLVRKPKMHDLIFDLVDAPISRTLWRVMRNAIF